MPLTPSSIRNYLSNFKISNDHVVLFIITSLLLYLTDSFFSVNNYLNTPQFSESCSKTWFETNAGTTNIILYNTYFVLDFFWIPTFLLLVYKFIKKRTHCKRNFNWIPSLVAFLAIICLVLDYAENIHYLTKYTYPEAIADKKNSIYAIILVLCALVAIWDLHREQVLIIKHFLKSAWVSLLILFIFGLTLPEVPQFNSIVVDLYYKNFQFALLFLGIFTPVYVVVLSHYPNYFLFASNNNKIAKKDWRMTDRWWLFGTIWFINIKASVSNKEYENQIGFLRKTIGILYLSAVFYLLADTADTNFDCKIKIAKFTIPFMIAMIWLLYYHSKKYAKWRKNNNPYLKTALQDTSASFYEKEHHNVTPHKSLLSISKYSKLYAISLVLSVMFLIFLFINLQIDKVAPYNIKNVVISLLCVVSQSVTYIYYRIYRSSFKYTFFNPKHNRTYYAFNIYNKSAIVDNTDKSNRKKVIIRFFKTNNFKGGKWGCILKLFANIRVNIFGFDSFSNSVVFLKKFIYTGFLNLCFLIFFNIFNEYAKHINPVLIILSYFLLFYGIIVILIKHGIYYYTSTDSFATINRSKYFKTLTGIAFVLLLLNYLARFNTSTKNNLYKLHQLEREQITPTTNNTLAYNEITLNEYVNNLPDSTNRFYVGCYGGGMKANAWTMTVLDSLDRGFNFMSKATCLSGASGGTIGLINYSNIKHNAENDATKTARIERIATENILGIDLIHFFGRDFLTHLFIPEIDLKGRDRSTAAMKVYADYGKYPYKKLSSRLFDKKTFRGYWKEMYQNNNHKFPVLIVNTTNIKGKQGMAVSVTSKGLAQQALYFGADNIVEIDSLGKSKTLSYYNAASTSNRFPLLSPAATIEGKGQYSDGGIFDNSGLLSALKFHLAIEVLENTNPDTLATKKARKDVFINIVNSKDLYIKNYLDDFFKDNPLECFSQKINEVTEIPAIINSISSTEMIPDHTKNRINFLAKIDDFMNDGNRKFISIYLPHTFNLNDVKRLYKPEIISTECVDALTNLIDDNNNEIKRLVSKITKTSKKHIPIIEPELSRLIAKPAYLFMTQMLKHSCVSKELDKLKPLLK